MSTHPRVYRRRRAAVALGLLAVATLATKAVAAPSPQPDWMPIQRVASPVQVVRHDPAETELPPGIIDQSSVVGLVPQRLVSAAARAAARWTYLPGESAFNERLDDLVLKAIAAHGAAQGLPAYHPAPSPTGAGLGDRGCRAGSTLLPAAEILADAALAPQGTGGPVVTVVCDVVYASGPYFGERVRVVSGTPEAVSGDTTTVLYTDTSTGQIVEAADIVRAGAVDEVWAPTVSALRLAAGALWEMEATAPSESARAAVESALLRASITADGSLALPFDMPLEGPEFASLAGFDPLFPTLVTLPAEQGRELFALFGQSLLDTAAAKQPYTGLPDLPAAADRTNCDLVPCVAVTFDDGPGPNTPAVLDALAQADASATFFLLGPAAERFPDTVKRAFAEGHTIGTHTWSHPELTGLTDAKIAEEVERTQRAVATITGQTPAYFRPPYGALNERVTRKLADLGLPAVLWDVDSADWQVPPAAVLFDNAVTPAKDGSIILFHDIKANTVEQVPAVLDGLRDRGFSLVTLDHLLGGTPPPPGSTLRSANVG